MTNTAISWRDNHVFRHVIISVKSKLKYFTINGHIKLSYDTRNLCHDILSCYIYTQSTLNVYSCMFHKFVLQSMQIGVICMCNLHKIDHFSTLPYTYCMLDSKRYLHSTTYSILITIECFNYKTITLKFNRSLVLIVWKWSL